MGSAGVLAFDLDGTLVDSLAGIHASLVHACTQMGLAPPALAALRARIGPPLRQYLPDLLSLEAESQQAMLEPLLQAFRNHHDSQGWRAFSLYDGVASLLQQLQVAGYGLHVVTQKPHAVAVAVLRQAGLDSYLTTVDGPRGGASFDKTSSLLRLRQPNHRCYWYVGDTTGDRQAAAAAGYRFVAATYGYGFRDGWGVGVGVDAAIDVPLDLLQVLEAAV